jgi:hypothetical protein
MSTRCEPWTGREIGFDPAGVVGLVPNRRVRLENLTY